MSEVTTPTTEVQNQPETVKVENTGGPQIPSAGKGPNNQGVPVEQVAETPAGPAEPAETSAAPTLEALKDLVGSDKSDTLDTESLETGNPVIDGGVALLQKVAGLNSSDVQRALGKAMEFKNPALIDSEFLKERFGEHAEYAEQLCKAFFQESQNQTNAMVQSVYDAAGGPEQWAVIKESFKAQAPEHQQAAARALIDSGKVKEGVSLILDYCRSQGLVVVQGSQVKGQAGLAGAALSHSEFNAEYTKLRKEAGNRSMESGPFAARYQSLLQRRQAGRAIGR